MLFWLVRNGADGEGEVVISDVPRDWYPEGKALTRSTLLFILNRAERSSQDVLSMKRKMHMQQSVLIECPHSRPGLSVDQTRLLKAYHQVPCAPGLSA